MVEAFDEPDPDRDRRRPLARNRKGEDGALANPGAVPSSAPAPAPREEEEDDLMISLAKGGLDPALSSRRLRLENNDPRDRTDRPDELVTEVDEPFADGTCIGGSKFVVADDGSGVSKLEATSEPKILALELARLRLALPSRGPRRGRVKVSSTASTATTSARGGGATTGSSTRGGDG